MNRRDDAVIIGKKFGKLTVIKFYESRNQQRCFECLCDCGNVKILPKGLLNFGSVKSCGCSKSYKDFDEIFDLNTREKNGCLVWTGSVTRDGYGRFKFKKKSYSAHRAYWEFKMGAIPKGMIIGHHCDNRACIKIEHLFLSTPSANSKDMVRKGRQAKGSKNGSAKLNEVQVVQILLTPPEIPISVIAKQHGVDHTTIRNVIAGKTWKDVFRKINCPKQGIKPPDRNLLEYETSTSASSNIKKVSPGLRVKVLNRDNSTCKICGVSLQKSPDIQLHADHIIPLAKGGKTVFDNLQTLCSSCNLGKGTQILT